MSELSAFLQGLPDRAEVRLLVLVFARLLPLVVFTPLFGGEALPRRLRVGTALVLSLVLVPALSSSYRPIDAPFVAQLTKEVLMGIGYAVAVTIVFEMLGAVGALIDLSRGATIANVLNPMTRQQTSLLSVFVLQLMLVLVFVSGGHRLLFATLGESFITSAPGAPLAPGFAVAGASTMIGLVSEFFALALSLAGPAILVLLALDVALALVNRMAQQIEVFFLSLTLKASIGLAVLLLTLGLVLEVGLERSLHRLLVILRGG